MPTTDGSKVRAWASIEGSMSGYEANSLFYAIAGLLIWPWILHDYPKRLRSAHGPAGRRRLRVAIILIGVGLGAGAVAASVSAVINGHVLTFIAAFIAALGHVLFTSYFVFRRWDG